MAAIDVDPFGEHESRTDEPMDEHILLDPVTPGRSTWEPDRGEQETLFGGESQRTKLMKDYVKDLYKRLSENIDETPELFHYDYFKLEGRELYYTGSRKPLTTEGKLKSVGMLADISGKNRLRRLGFNIPVGNNKKRSHTQLDSRKQVIAFQDSDHYKHKGSSTPTKMRKTSNRQIQYNVENFDKIHASSASVRNWSSQ